MIKYAVFIAFINVFSMGALYSHSLADLPEFKEQFVYKMNLFDGKKITETFIPQNEDTIYVLAEENNILSPRVTLVHWWPLSGQYVAGYQKLNEEVPGTLEILSAGDKITSKEKEEYVLFYPNTISGDLSEMHVGKEAYNILKKFKDPLLEYYKKYDDYNRKMVEFQNAFMVYAEDLEKKKRAGIKLDPQEIKASMPQMPQPPEKPNFDITGLRYDFIVNLPEGVYTIRLRAKNGTIVEGSTKKLVAFSRRRVGGVGYEIIPKNRWTKRENSNDSSQTIYAVGENTLYLRGFHEDEYNERYYRKLLNPQSQGSAKRWIWVHTRPIKDVLLVLKGKSGDLKKVAKLPYMVKQVPGPTLGYEILPYTEKAKLEKKRPSFEGHMINIAPVDDGGKFSLWLENINGQLLRGSERKVLEVRREKGNYLYLISFFPVIAGAVVAFKRRRFTA